MHELSTERILVTELAERVAMLDISLFDAVPAQLQDWDRRALLSLHAAVAAASPSFTYLEIGSYLGGSLQVLVRDPRCVCIISIDPRLAQVPDKRSAHWSYEENTTDHMVQRLREVPGADMSKLVSLDMGSENVCVNTLPARPNLCFIDGEHTDEAVLRDAELCMSAVDGEGVIAFHDYGIVQAGIRAFLRTHWRELSMALAAAGNVFAVEIGSQRVLRSVIVDRAIGSRWHSVAWKTGNLWRRSPSVLLGIWAAMPHVDAGILEIRRRLNRPHTAPGVDRFSRAVTRDR